MNRLDKEYLERRREIPFLQERPSHYMRRFFYGTQPIEEPERTRDIVELFGLFDGENQAMFASDWPHHDFDHPQHFLGLPFSPEARRKIMGLNAAAFLIGWSVSLIIVFAASYAIGGANATQHGSGSTAVKIIEMLLGAALVVAGARQWRRRHRPRTSSGVSKKFAGRLEQLNAWEAAAVGILKQPWSLTAAAAVVLVRHHSALSVVVFAFVAFAVLSTATVGLIFVYFARRPGAAEAHLSDLRDRLQRTGPAVFAVASAVVGVCLIVDGVIGLVKS